jgi:Ca-activated chloride channel family protein
VASERQLADLSDPPYVPSPNEIAKLPFGFEDAVAWSRSVKNAIDERTKSRSALGAGGEFDRLPDLDSFESPSPRGIIPPRVRGYDLLFHLKQGEHPFASPLANKALASSKMPFTFRTASYDLAVGTAREGEAPSGDDIRVEDFLAAQDYALPAAPMNGLALHTAAVASPFRDAGLHLLQLVVKAGPKKAVAHRPTRLVTLVDVSRRMAGGGRWETTLRALAKIADDMSPADRLTIIAFAEQPRVLAASATGRELRALIASDALPKLAGSADFAAATRAAGEAVKTAPGIEVRRVVFITAGREIHGDSTLDKSRESLAQLTAEHVPWRIVRLSADDGQPLEDLASETQGAVIAATSASEIRAALWEQLTGQSSTVANGVSLKLTFNPKVVTGYRLLGHASGTITGEAGDPLEVDLRVEQMATAMYELWIKPAGGEQIAAVELTWRDPAGARQRRVAQWIRRAQIAESFSQAAPWFQQGVIAAKTAEVLRGSYFASGARLLDQIHDLARQVDPHTAEQADFQALVRLLEQVQKLR